MTSFLFFLDLLKYNIQQYIKQYVNLNDLTIYNNSKNQNHNIDCLNTAFAGLSKFCHARGVAECDHSVYLS
jgi:hypothetical protein